MSTESNIIWSFKEKIISFAKIHDMFPENGIIISAVSGGADSISLLDALHGISNKHNFTVVAAHFNHKLRGDESERDEAFVIDECKIRNIKLYTGSADVNHHSKISGLGIVETARELRYDFLTNIAEELSLSEKKMFELLQHIMLTILLKLFY